MKLPAITTMDSNRPVNLMRATATCNAFYVFLSAAKAALLPFLTLFFRLIGLSAFETGIVMAAKTLTGFFWAPLWARCAVAYNKRRVVLIFSLLMMGVMYMSFTAVYYKIGNLKDCQIGTTDQDGNKTSLVAGPHNFSINAESSLPKTTASLPPKPVQNTTESPLQNSGDIGNNQLMVNVSDILHNTTQTPARDKGSTTMPRTNEESTQGNPEHQETQSYLSSDEGAVAPAPPTVSQESNVQSTHAVNKSMMTMEDLDNLNVKLEKDTGFTLQDIIDKGLSAHSVYLLANKRLPNFVLSEDQIQQLFALQKQKNRGSAESAKLKRSSDRYTRNLNITFLNTLKTHVGELTAVLEDKKLLLFIVVLLVIIFGEFFSSPVEKIADDAWFDFLERIDDLERYGRQRYWGSLSFALIPIVVTCLVDYTPCHMLLSLHHFLLHFYIFGIFMIFTIFIAFYFPMPPPVKQKYNSKLKKGLQVICCDPRGFLFAVTLLVAGMVYATYNNFLFWHLQDMGASEITMGLCVAIGAFAETPMLFFSNKLVRKLGNSGLVSLSLLAFAVRLLYYGFLWSPWAVLPAELTNAFTHTALWYAILSYEEFNIGSAMDRSIRSILSSFYFGLGFSAGAFLSGLVYQEFGAPVLFWAASGLCGFWCVLFSVIQLCLPKREKVKYIKLLRKEEDESSDADDDWLEMALKDQ